MAKRYLNTIASRLKTSNPNTHVSPSNGSSTAEPLRSIFAFLNIASAFEVLLPFNVLEVCVALTWWVDRTLFSARIKKTRLT